MEETVVIADEAQIVIHGSDGWNLMVELLNFDGGLSSIEIYFGPDALSPFHEQISWEGCPELWQRIFALYQAGDSVGAHLAAIAASVRELAVAVVPADAQDGVIVIYRGLPGMFRTHPGQRTVAPFDPKRVFEPIPALVAIR